MDQINSIVSKNHLPWPTTFLFILINVIVYLIFKIIPFNESFCYFPNNPITLEYALKRLLTTFIHLSQNHLFGNLATFYNFGYYEQFIGSTTLFWVITAMTFSTSILNELLYRLTYSHQVCSIGFSGVIIALLVYSYKFGKIGMLYGKSVNKIYAIIVNLMIIHLTDRNASIIGHGSGFIIGLLSLLF